jgi:hypothetical protein
MVHMEHSKLESLMSEPIKISDAPLRHAGVMAIPISILRYRAKVAEHKGDII